MYLIKYYLDWLSSPLWGANEAAREKFGYNILLENLGLSDSVIKEAHELSIKMWESLDQNDPGGELLWTQKEFEDFEKSSKALFEHLRNELSPDFDLITDYDF